MPRSTVVLAATLALALAGTAAGANGWPRVERNAADQALATKSVLHITDFTPGSGWKAMKDDSRSGDVSVPSCDGPAFSQVGQVSTGTASTSFATSGLRIWSEASVMKTLAMARTDEKQVSSPLLMQCLRDAFEREMPADVKLVATGPISFPAIGSWSRAVRCLLDVTTQGRKVRLQTDIVFVLTGRVELTLMQMAPYSLSAGAKAAEIRMAQHLAFNALTA